MPKSHVLSPSGQFLQSPYLTDLALYVGQELVFADGQECLLKVGGIEITGKQIERLCHHYGQLLEDQPTAGVPEGDSPAKSHYVMVDGSMVLTRQDGWSEIKLGRVFPTDSVLECGKSRKWVHESHYTAHMGTSAEFLEKLDLLISPCSACVFIADGARWIWRHIEEHYPSSVQILDYYHALQYLHEFGREHFRHQARRKAFIEECTGLIDEGSVSAVIEKVCGITPSAKSGESHKKLITYYTNNEGRMRYKEFREQGYAIGSGAMESANRTVIQERVKRSGQRWTKEGIQQVVNLRVAHQSDQWSIVTNLIRNAA